jgi:multiple sugar transport system permease protein
MILGILLLMKKKIFTKFQLKEFFENGIIYLSLIIGSGLIIIPFLWMLSTSVTPALEVFSWPPKLVPSQIKFSNYVEAVKVTDFFRYFLNSLFVTSTTTVIAVFINSLAGYSLAKLRFPGRKIIFLFILGTIMIPPQVTMIPVFIMFRNFPLLGGNNILGQGGTGLIDTYGALILSGLASTFGVYLMREFFKSIPSELIDAARVDGASEFRIYWNVILPLAKPALTTVTLYTFTFVWNEFLWPLILTSSADMRTVQLGLSAYKGQYFTDWHLLMAATTISSLPVLLVYFVGQKQFIKGIAMTGIKG